MRLCFTKSFVLTLATLVVLLVPLSVQAAYYGYSAPSPSYGNYGNYNAANDMTCGYSNTRFGASSHGGSCASCFRFGPPPRSIKYIMLGLNARIPTGWAMGQEVIGSNNGGMAVSLSATGFQQSLVNEVSAILFKDPLSDQVLYPYRQDRGEETRHTRCRCDGRRYRIRLGQGRYGCRSARHRP